jgi:hypothetical protein
VILAPSVNFATSSKDHCPPALRQSFGPAGPQPSTTIGHLTISGQEKRTVHDSTGAFVVVGVAAFILQSEL